MAAGNENLLPALKVSVGWIEVEVIAEPLVRLSIKGYTPILPVKVAKTGLTYVLYMGAKSFAEGLEPLRKQNNGAFKGLRFRIKKESSEQFSPYRIEASSSDLGPN